MKSGVQLVIVAVVVTIGSLVCLAASTEARRLFGVPVPWVALIVAFGIQWVAFVPAYLRKTEHFYDLTGSLTYISVMLLLLVTGAMDLRSMVLAVMVMVWAVRLGTFLFRRVRRAGRDGRFDAIKTSWSRFLVAWTLQGLWVFLTLSATIAAMAQTTPAPLSLLDALGIMVWTAGFAIEVVADRQKSAFKARNPTGFINSGLWSRSRHPNYFGEIVLWAGIAIMAASTLHGWQWVTMISPVFVYVLLTRVSGVPLLEQRSDARWGDDPEYLAYKQRTPVLVPRLF